MTPRNSDARTEGPLAEYVSLRGEIERRSGEQHTLVTTQLTFAGAVFGFILSQPQRTLLGLVLPVVTYTLIARFMANELSIRRIATYLRVELERKVPGGFGWESWGRNNPAKHPVLLWVLPITFCFPGTSTAALVITFPEIIGTTPPMLRNMLLAAWTIAVAMTFMSACIVVVNQKGFKYPLWVVGARRRVFGNTGASRQDS